jgi:PPOX class probable F420-dependent enzyme
MAATIGERERKILDAPNYAHVATLRGDGTVHGVVVWVDADDASILLNSAEGRAWPANVRRDPRVTITVANHENPYEYVEIRGRVVEDTHDGADEHIDALAKKYLGKDTYPFRQPGEQRVKFVIEPERVRYAGG